MRERRESGVTMVELVISVFILAAVATIATFGAQFITQAFAHRALVDVHRDAQVALYGIIRDVRNSKDIVYVSSETLRLRAFDFPRFGYSNIAIFNPVNIGTVTYQYTEDEGARFLLRRTEFPGRMDDRKLLRDVIIRPTADNYIFRGISANNAPPFDTVDVALRLQPGFANVSRLGPSSVVSSTMTYQGQAMRRTRIN